MVRRGGIVSLVATTAAAVALTGTAVITVVHAGCSRPGHFVQHDGWVVEFVGGCLAPDDLPSPPRLAGDHQPADTDWNWEGPHNGPTDRP